MGVATDNGVTIYSLLLFRIEEILAKTEKKEHRTRCKFGLRTSPATIQNHTRQLALNNNKFYIMKRRDKKP